MCWVVSCGRVCKYRPAGDVRTRLRHSCVIRKGNAQLAAPRNYDFLSARANYNNKPQAWHGNQRGIRFCCYFHFSPRWVRRSTPLGMAHDKQNANKHSFCRWQTDWLHPPATMLNPSPTRFALFLLWPSCGFCRQLPAAQNFQLFSTFLTPSNVLFK